MHFGQYIRELRQSKKINLSDAARELDVSPQFLCDLETGRRSFSRRPNLKLLQKFADLYDHPYSSLVKSATMIHRQRTFIVDLLKELEPKADELERILLDVFIEAKVCSPELEQLTTKAYSALQSIKVSLLSTRRSYGNTIDPKKEDADETVD